MNKQGKKLKISDFQNKFNKLLLDSTGVYRFGFWKRTECAEFKKELDEANIENFERIVDKVVALKLNLDDHPKCSVCGSYDVKVNKNGFRTTCSIKCSANSSEVIEKTRKTIYQRYGGVHYTQNKEWIKDFVNNCKERGSYQKGIETFKEKYGVDNRFQLESVKEKIKQTHIERYGVDNPQKNKEIKEKTRKTCLERYGKSTGFPVFFGESNPQFNYATRLKTRLTKIKSINLEEYEKNKTFLYVSLMYDKHICECKHCHDVFEVDKLDDECFYCFGRKSIQKDLGTFIKSLGFDYVMNDRQMLNGKELDIYIPAKRFAIELDGIYWHSEKQLEKRHKNVKNYHVDKTIECESDDIQLIHIFETEWVNQNELVKSILKAKLGVFDLVIGARKTQLTTISNKESTEFLKDNHLQGATLQQPIKMGLWYDNELVMVMTFGTPRFNKKDKDCLELLRFASKKGMNIQGGASKIINYVLKTYGKSIITFADRRWSAGNVYSKIGFELINTTPPNYWYHNTFELQSRMKFQKHKLKTILENFDESLSEWENMRNNGYDRIWDCGNHKFKINPV